MPLRILLALAFTVAVALVSGGCSRVTIQSESAKFAAIMPAWPWQDSTRAIEKMNLSAKGTNFTASLSGLNDTETTSTNATRMLTDVVGAVVGAAVKAAK
jgi:hypothetical protein